MASTGLLLAGAVSTVVFAVGVLFATRADTVVTFQELYAAGLSVEPPADVAGREWRRRTLRQGGFVLAAGGALGLLAVAYWLYVV